MWQKLVAYIRELLLFADKMENQRKDIRDLQDEVRQLTVTMRLLIGEMDHFRKIEQSEREKLELRLKIALLESNKQLPPSETEK